MLDGVRLQIDCTNVSSGRSWHLSFRILRDSHIWGGFTDMTCQIRLVALILAYTDTLGITTMFN